MIQALRDIKKFFTMTFRDIMLMKRNIKICTLLVLLIIYLIAYTNIKLITATPIGISVLYLLAWFLILYLGKESFGLMMFSTIISGLTIFSGVVLLLYTQTRIEFFAYFFLPPPLGLGIFIMSPLWGLFTIEWPIYVIVLNCIAILIWFIASLRLLKRLKAAND